MRLFKILLAIIVILLSLAPIAMFIPLFFKSTMGWILLIKKLPMYTYYIVGASVIISQTILLINGVKLMKRKRYI
jgi:hypothetical protein